MGKDRRAKPEHQIKLAKDRMKKLLEMALTANEKHAMRYFALAKKIGMRFNVPIPREYKRKFCKNCFAYLKEGWRLKKGVAHVTCKNCGKSMRYPYGPKKKK